MPPTNETTVNQDKEGRFRTNIPKGLAEAMGIENGEIISWSVKSGNKLEVEIE